MRFNPATRAVEFVSIVQAATGPHIQVLSSIVIPKGVFSEKQLQVVIALCKTVNHFTLGHDVTKDVRTPSTTSDDGKVTPEKVTPSRVKKLAVLLETANVKPLAEEAPADR